MKRIALLAVMVVLGETAAGQSGIAKEPITLRGVPFGVPGVAQSLKALCLATASDPGNPMWCKIEPIPVDPSTKQMPIPGMVYGNLDFYSHAYFDEAEALHYYKISAYRPLQAELLSLLTAKYGQPKVTVSMVETKGGEKFENPIYEWTDKQGTRLRLTSIDDMIKFGAVEIESRSRVEAQAQAEKIRADALKNQL